jgi:hypothetical protein
MYINPQTIELDGLDDLIALTAYQSRAKSLPGGGYVLSENLANNKGGILYAQGVEIDHEKIQRLSKLSENNKDWDLKFSIQKNEALTETLRNRIKDDFGRMIETRKGRQEYRKMMEKVESTLEKYYTDIVSSDEMVYALIQAKYSELDNNDDNVTPMFNNAIHNCLLIIGIFQHAFEVTNTRFTHDDIMAGAQAGLLSSLGGIETSPMYKTKPIEEKEIRFSGRKPQ